jgi:hypothetical protein
MSMINGSIAEMLAAALRVSPCMWWPRLYSGSSRDERAASAAISARPSLTADKAPRQQR